VVARIAAACTSLWAGADLLDDLADAELDPSLSDVPEPLLTLVACNLMLTIPVALLDGLPGRLAGRVASTLAVMSGGQAADLLGLGRDRDACHRIVDAKAGAQFAMGAELTALAAGEPPERVHGWSRFGRHLGVMAQLFSDVRELLVDEPARDLLAGRPTWPVGVARDLLRGEDGELLEALLERCAAGDEDAVAELRELLGPTPVPLTSLALVELNRFRAARALPMDLSTLDREHPVRTLLAGWSILPVALQPQIGGTR